MYKIVRLIIFLPSFKLKRFENIFLTQTLVKGIPLIITMANKQKSIIGGVTMVRSWVVTGPRHRRKPYLHNKINMK